MKKLLLLPLAGFIALSFTSCESEEEKAQALLQEKHAKLEQAKLEFETWKLKSKSLLTQKSEFQKELRKVESEKAIAIHNTIQKFEGESYQKLKQEVALIKKEREIKIKEAFEKSKPLTQKDPLFFSTPAKTTAYYAPINDKYSAQEKEVKEASAEAVANFKEETKQKFNTQYEAQISELKGKIEEAKSQITQHNENMPVMEESSELSDKMKAYNKSLEKEASKFDPADDQKIGLPSGF